MFLKRITLSFNFLSLKNIHRQKYLTQPSTALRPLFVDPHLWNPPFDYPFWSTLLDRPSFFRVVRPFLRVVLPPGWINFTLKMVVLLVSMSVHPPKRGVHPFLRVNCRVGRVNHPKRLDVRRSNTLQPIFFSKSLEIILFIKCLSKSIWYRSFVLYARFGHLG